MADKYPWRMWWSADRAKLDLAREAQYEAQRVVDAEALLESIRKRKRLLASSPKPCCYGCRFFVPHPDVHQLNPGAVFGDCRRYPKVSKPIYWGSSIWQYAQQEGGEDCGEFAPTDEHRFRRYAQTPPSE